MHMVTVTAVTHVLEATGILICDNDDSSNNPILWLWNTSVLKGSIFYLISHSPLVEMLFWPIHLLYNGQCMYQVYILFRQQMNWN